MIVGVFGWELGAWWWCICRVRPITVAVLDTCQAGRVLLHHKSCKLVCSGVHLVFAVTGCLLGVVIQLRCVHLYVYCTEGGSDSLR